MSREYLDYLHDLFSAFAPVTTRAMFGGHGVYRDGTIIGLVIDEALYLKADAQTRAVFRASGCEAFLYEAKGKAVPMSYWSVPEGIENTRFPPSPVPLACARGCQRRRRRSISAIAAAGLRSLAALMK